jgi:lipopolysaccharide biosynthesis glycosyltransferase
MDSCIATVVSDQFIFGAIALIGSLRNSNPDYSGAIVVIWNERYSPLSLSNRQLLAQVEPKVIFRHVDERAFSDVFHFAETVVQTPTRLRPAFMILDAFQLAGYNRVCALDSDMLVVGSLRSLFELPLHFGIVRATDDKSQPLPYFNTGTMLIAEPYLRSDFVRTLGAALANRRFDRRYGKADQAVLNLYFYERDKTYLDPRYNFSKRNAPDSLEDPLRVLDKEDVRVLHFLGEKPWNVKILPREGRYRTLERYWRKAYVTAAGPDGAAALEAHAVAQRAIKNAVLEEFSGRSESDLLIELEARLIAAAYHIAGRDQGLVDFATSSR